ncbi:hypothetical protein BT93_L1308 [Corymbia citriodora subsp. variegata]|uniref:TIR domain-containing protein n=1 Tax=Corymbia citriodora subsp. variegata TaxID=360336 RepID=A0A8T0CQH7_CORYI|nr:hypothetical protein BT93_L1308 [Corymbia citriodora subsp. variegata]
MEKGTSSQALSESSYEVFLSFRGSDTRHTFTDFLYHDMVEVGILVFRDSESLHVGEKTGKLLHAIENSKIYIPIFSKNYASSDWCLRELAHMVKCTSKPNGNKEIMPIFLDVEPADVKLKTKLYGQALSKRPKTCSEVESWENALIEVGRIIGWNWNADKSQADLIKSITEIVLHKLKIGNKKVVTEKLVGVDDRVKAIIKMLDVGSDSVQFLGIHGMGGIGKTTLAKVIFNQLSSHFRDCFFLSDVRESSQRHGMVYLQKQLLSKFLDSRSTLRWIYNVDSGINMIKRVFRNKKVLIVLDDVDEKEQLKNLAENCNWFGSGSRIIITTRNQSVLTIEGEAIDEGRAIILTYEVRQMELDHALKLFSRHAFRRDSPLDRYISLSEKIVRTLGNLPLALEITGSSLHGKSKTFWEDTLKKLEKAPPNEVQRKLMITYERLDYAQKQVFLDIACFFVYKDKTYPSYMWDACGYYPHRTLEDLFLMSLIKIKDDNTLWMHDQVRDLGREIVRKENPDDSCKLSRVRNPKDALSILRQKKGSRKIKALSLGSFMDRTQGITVPKFSNQIDILKPDEFAGLENLRYFRGEQVSFVGDFDNLLPDLRWLSCHNCPSMLEGKNFHLANLAVLNLSWSEISEKSIEWLKAARKLKVLDLSRCHNLRRIPYLSTLVSLEILEICFCVNLESIDGIEAARKLKVLDLNWCCCLRRAPDLSTLVALEILRLCDCWKIKKLPDSIEKLQSLIELDLRGTGIDHLPDSLSDLKQLRILKMREMKGGLAKLPRAVWLVFLSDFFYENPEGDAKLCCLKMPDLSWSQIYGLPTVENLVSNIHNKLELAARGGRRLRDPKWTPLLELENVFAFPTESIAPRSRLEEQILASPNMWFLRQLSPSSRELVLRETAQLPLDFSWPELHSNHCPLNVRYVYWMPIFLGICDSESEKLLMQDCTLSRRLQQFVSKMEEFTYRQPPQRRFRQPQRKFLVKASQKHLSSRM